MREDFVANASNCVGGQIGKINEAVMWMSFGKRRDIVMSKRRLVMVADFPETIFKNLVHPSDANTVETVSATGDSVTQEVKIDGADTDVALPTICTFVAVGEERLTHGLIGGRKRTGAVANSVGAGNSELDDLSGISARPEGAEVNIGNSAEGAGMREKSKLAIGQDAVRAFSDGEMKRFKEVGLR